MKLSFYNVKHDEVTRIGDAKATVGTDGSLIIAGARTDVIVAKIPATDWDWFEVSKYEEPDDPRNGN